MYGEISLAVAVKIQPPDRDYAIDRRFENAGRDGNALPRDLARYADINRDNSHDAPEMHAAAPPGSRCSPP